MFNEIIVAIFETDEDAEHAVADLLAANVPEAAIHRHVSGQDAAAAAEPMHEPGGFWHRLFGGHSADHALYDQVLHNGGNVLTITTVPGHDFEPVMDILERHNPIDLDEQAASFVGIAHSPDPVARGDSPAPAGQGSGEPLVNTGGARVRRFLRGASVTAQSEPSAE